MNPTSPRCIVIWFPDWPVTAWRGSQMQGGRVGLGGTTTGGEAVAVVAARRVLACSAAARAAGVRRGQRQRDAQAACPELIVVPDDPGRDQRAFEPVVVCIEDVAPGVQQIRPGLVMLRSHGPARYYGGEAEAAVRLIEELTPLGLDDARIGIADGVFAAEQAAYIAKPVRVVPPGASAQFLAPLPVDVLGDEEMSRLLPQLGLRRLGDFAALDAASVRDRFGTRGCYLHALAGGRDGQPVVPRTPPAQLARQIEFEPPLELAEQVAFSIRQTVDGFIAGVSTEHLVCTELRVVVEGETGEVVERVWLHPTAFDAPAVIDRVRWQLEATPGIASLASRVAKVTLEPVAVDVAYRHEPGLFGDSSDERVHYALSRVQALLGHTGVLTATIGGGRWLAERQVLVPWGDRAATAQPADRPWPGQLPAPLPAVVFSSPRPMKVTAVDGAPVRVGERGLLSAPPLVLADDAGRHRITGWAGPWPVDERTWDKRHRRGARFQVVDDAQNAWLLVLDDDGAWWAEGRYD